MFAYHSVFLLIETHIARTLQSYMKRFVIVFVGRIIGKEKLSADSAQLRLTGNIIS